MEKLHSWFNAKVISTLPMFIAVNLAALSIWFLGVSPEAMPLILGMIAAGLVEVDNRLVGRLKDISVMLVVFALSAFSTQIAMGHSVIFTVLMMLATFVITMIGTLGKRYATLSFGALLVAVYISLTYPLNPSWLLNPSLILIGAFLYSLSSLLVFLLFPNRAVQECVGGVFGALAAYLAQKEQFFDPDDLAEQGAHQLPLAVKNAQVIRALNECQGVLFYRIRGQRRQQIVRMMKYYFAAQEIFERVSADYFDYAQFVEKFQHTDLIFRIQRVLELQGLACKKLAHCLEVATPYVYDPRLDSSVKGLVQSLAYYQAQHKIPEKDLAGVRTLVESLQAVDWQLRHMEQQQDHQMDFQAVRSNLNPVQISGFKNIWQTLRSHCGLQSPAFRHTVRLSIVVFTSCVLVESLQLHFGYWILMTAILVCQPNYYATKLRLKQRIIGSVLGVLVASLLPYMQPTLPLELGVVVLATCCFFFFRNNNYSYATFFVTVQVLVSFYIMGFDIADAMFTRIADTLVGVSIAFLASSYLWPDWKYWKLHNVTLQCLKADARYLLMIVTQLQLGKCDPLQYRIARRSAQDTASRLSDIVNAMNSDKKRYEERLPAAFELLKLNYTLLSYISALGAYRDTMQKLHQSSHFSAAFYPIARAMIDLLNQIGHLSPTAFDEKLHEILTTLQTCNDNQTHKEEYNIPLQQFNLMAQSLAHLYFALQREQRLEAPCADCQ